jgi:hypothetical protein
MIITRSECSEVLHLLLRLYRSLDSVANLRCALHVIMLVVKVVGVWLVNA